jgi:peptidoglycan/LPS O-acetylase OafA/YrhL
MSKRIEPLDTLRGMAAMNVVIFHCLISYNLFNLANYKGIFGNTLVKIFTVTPLHILWAGKEAVLLFFVLSGFVLSIPYVNNRAPSYGAFVIKRIFRIYIPYVIIMGISVLLVMFLGEYNNIQGLSNTYLARWDHPVSLKSIVAYILMLNVDTANVNGVVWTLFIEMKASILFPFIMLIITKFKLLKSLLISLSISISMFIILSNLVNIIDSMIIRVVIGYFSDSLYYCIFFIMGAILSKNIEKVKLILSVKVSQRVLLYILSLVLISNQWLYFFNVNIIELQDIISAIGILLLFSMVLSSKKASSILALKPLLFIGKISYSLYMVHIPILMLSSIFISKLIPLALAFCLVPFISILVAWVCYISIEQPAMNLGKRFANRFDNLNIFKFKNKNVKSEPL